jgi:ferredoxin
VKYKIEIERGGCTACGTCYSVDPSHFEPDEEEKSTVIGEKLMPMHLWESSMMMRLKTPERRKIPVLYP